MQLRLMTDMHSQVYTRAHSVKEVIHLKRWSVDIEALWYMIFENDLQLTTVTSLLPQWKTFENWSAFGEVMSNNVL